MSELTLGGLANGKSILMKLKLQAQIELGKSERMDNMEKEKFGLVNVQQVKNFVSVLKKRQDVRLALSQAAKSHGDLAVTAILVSLANETGEDIYQLKQIIKGAK